MCHKLAIRIIDSCKSIVSLDSYEVIRYTYGMEVFLEFVWKLIGIVIVGVLIPRRRIFYLAIICFVLLRINAGGKHCKKSISCFVAMIAIGLLSMCLSEWVHMSTVVGCIFFAIFLIAVQMYAPYITTDLSHNKFSRKKRLTSLTLIIYLLLFIGIQDLTFRHVFLYSSIMEILSIVHRKGKSYEK